MRPSLLAVPVVATLILAACKAQSSNSSSPSPVAGANGSGSTADPGSNISTQPNATTPSNINTATNNSDSSPGTLAATTTTGMTTSTPSGLNINSLISGITALQSGFLNTNGSVSPVPAASLVTGAAGSANPCIAAASCQPINPDLLAPLTAGGLVGVVGQNVSWLLAGLDRNSLGTTNQTSARNVLILVYNLPTGAVPTPIQTTGQISTIAQINWTPTAAASGNFSLIMRDYDRCVINLSVATCGQFAYIAQYDTRMDGVPYVISAKNVLASALTSSAGAINGAAPSPAANPATTMLTGLLTTGFQNLISNLIPAATAAK